MAKRPIILKTMTRVDLESYVYLYFNLTSTLKWVKRGAVNICKIRLTPCDHEYTYIIVG